jgi:hypothetical protein
MVFLALPHALQITSEILLQENVPNVMRLVKNVLIQEPLLVLDAIQTISFSQILFLVFQNALKDITKMILLTALHLFVLNAHKNVTSALMQPHAKVVILATF